MAWDFLSSSRDLVGLVLPPAKRMIGALVPPAGKVSHKRHGGGLPACLPDRLLVVFLDVCFALLCFAFLRPSVDGRAVELSKARPH